MTIELSTLGAVIKETYEGQDDTNAFSDAEKIKLANLEGLQAADREKLDATLVFTQAEKDKLGNTEVFTSAEKEKLSDTTVFTEAEKTKLAESSVFTEAEKTKLADSVPFTIADKEKLTAQPVGQLANVATTGLYDDLVDVPNLIPMMQKAAAGGVATLDNSGKVPLTQLNVSGLVMKGAWNAETNTPALLDGTGNVGDFYKVGTAGTANFGNGFYTFAIGDWVIFAGGTWQRIGVHESVASVNGQTGMIVLTAGDVGALPADYQPTWNSITGKPELDAKYKPIGYLPAWSEISGKPDFAALYKAAGYVPAWAEITGKPNFGTLYKAIGYIPAWDEVTNKPNFGSLYKAIGYVPAWSEVTGKPAFDTLYQKKQRGTIGPAIPAGLFRKNANQAFSQNSNTTVSWQVSVYDQFSIRSGNNFVVPSWAKYVRVLGHFQWGGSSSSGGGVLYGQIMLNGAATPGASPCRIFGNTNVLSNSFSTGIIPVKSGDVITIRGLQNTSASRNIEFGSEGQGTWVQFEFFE